MTDSRNPIAQALDLMVFAPIGLAITVVEDFPELAEKGRVRIRQQAATAKLVGQFAVAEGRRRLQAQGAWPGPSPAAQAPPSGPGGSTQRSARATPQTAHSGPVAGPAPQSSTGPVGVPLAAGGSGRGPAAASGPVADSEHLGIPGYDSLSASQVVQRLPSLSAAELDAVRDYETATRGRRTILSRISQLQQD